MFVHGKNKRENKKVIDKFLYVRYDIFHINPIN